MNDILSSGQYLLPTFFVDEIDPFPFIADMQDVNYLRNRAAHYEKLAAEMRAMADRLEGLEKGESKAEAVTFPAYINDGQDIPFNMLPGVQQIELALKAHNRKPAKRRSVWAWMEQSGTKLSVASFKSYLSQNPKFKRLGHDQWVLTEDYPDAPAAPNPREQKAVP